MKYYLNISWVKNCDWNFDMYSPGMDTYTGMRTRMKTDELGLNKSIVIEN